MIDHDRPTWQQRAACHGSDPDLFFPAEAEGENVDAAKAVCEGCEVRIECLLHAVNEGEEWGIWGGLREDERRRIRRGRARGMRCIRYAIDLYRRDRAVFNGGAALLLAPVAIAFGVGVLAGDWSPFIGCVTGLVAAPVLIGAIVWVVDR